MTNLLTAVLIAASLGSSAQAAVTAQDQTWIDKMNFAVNDALNQASDTSTKVGVVYVPVTVGAKGRVRVASAPQSCGCPDLDRAALDAVSAMGRVARPPADLTDQRILVKAVFEAPQAHGDLSRAQFTACGGLIGWGKTASANPRPHLKAGSFDIRASPGLCCPGAVHALGAPP